MQEVADLIEELPRDEKTIMRRLRGLILNTDPRIQEKLSLGVPYFYHTRQICFLWPASLVPCGHEKPETVKVTLGLCYGNLLSNVQGLLEAGNRKQVYIIPFDSMQDIDEKAIIEIIQEAVLVDDEFMKKKKR